MGIASQTQTNKGSQSKMTVFEVEDFDIAEEMAEILNDPTFMSQIKESVRELDAGKGIELKDLLK